MDILSSFNLDLTAGQIVFACYLVSGAVQALPEPEPASSKLYVWVYRFSHLAVANLKPATKKIAEGGKKE